MSIFGHRIALANQLIDAEFGHPFWYQPMTEVVNADPQIDDNRGSGVVIAILLQPGVGLGRSWDLNNMHERSTSEPTLFWMARGLLVDVRRFDRFILRPDMAHNPDVATGTRAYEIGDGPRPIGFGRYRAGVIEITSVTNMAVSANIKYDLRAMSAVITYEDMPELPWV